MSAISDFKTKFDNFITRHDAAVAGLKGDLEALAAKIEVLQNTPGTITPEDQGHLDSIEAMTDAAIAKLEALDAMNAPVPPVA